VSSCFGFVLFVSFCVPSVVALFGVLVCLLVCLYVFVRCRSCSCVAVPWSVFSFVLGMLAFLLLCFPFVSVPFVYACRFFRVVFVCCCLLRVVVRS